MCLSSRTNVPKAVFSCLLEITQSSERAAQEDCMQQQEIMMQMINQNQQMMMAILASLGRDNTGGIRRESTRSNRINNDNSDENTTK